MTATASESTLAQDLAHLPPILKTEDMAAVLRLSKGTIRRDCQRGTFLPKPFHRRPYMWLRVDLVAYLESLQASSPARVAPATVQPTRRRGRVQ